MEVTKSHLTLAKRLGACESVGKYRAGTNISRVPRSDLMFVEERAPAAAREVASQLMAEAAVPVIFGQPSLADFGSGDGDGYGYGYGSGSGDGSGYGYGYGYGDGYGYGYGSCYGYGSGYGYGYGYGSGYGSGSCYGSGSGYGSGYGDGYGEYQTA